MRISKGLLILVVLLLIVTLAVGCTRTKIGDILQDPKDYQGKSVSIKGTVDETIWLALLSKGAYQVGDGTGTIWIITNQPPPEEGRSVSVKGIVQPAFSLGNSTFGTIIMESEIKQ